MGNAISFCVNDCSFSNHPDSSSVFSKYLEEVEEDQSSHSVLYKGPLQTKFISSSKSDTSSFQKISEYQQLVPEVAPIDVENVGDTKSVTSNESVMTAISPTKDRMKRRNPIK